jgi:hypothetical protein
MVADAFSFACAKVRGVRGASMAAYRPGATCGVQMNGVNVIGWAGSSGQLRDILKLKACCFVYTQETHAQHNTGDLHELRVGVVGHVVI